MFEPDWQTTDGKPGDIGSLDAHGPVGNVSPFPRPAARPRSSWRLAAAADPSPAQDAGMPWLSLQSSQPIPWGWLQAPNRFGTAPPDAAAARRNDDSLICACPDCQAPMLIRRWLMSGDCWRCGANVVVSARWGP